MARPTGTVTFLFTDIEDSTPRWESDPDGMRRALAVHVYFGETVRRNTRVALYGDPDTKRL